MTKRTIAYLLSALAVLFVTGQALSVGAPDPVTWSALMFACAALSAADLFIPGRKRRVGAVDKSLGIGLIALTLCVGGALVRQVLVDPTFALGVAAAGGHDQMVRWSMGRGADPGKSNALENAISHRRRSTVRLLLELGADPNRYDDRRGPLAFMAAQVSDQVILQDLWQHGANLDAKYSVNGMTALQQALVSGNDSMVKFLIKQGADPDVQNDAGWTALMVATCRDRPEFGWVGLLLEHGANRSLKDKAGHIALDYAVQCNSTNSVQLLR